MQTMSLIYHEFVKSVSSSFSLYVCCNIDRVIDFLKMQQSTPDVMIRSNLVGFLFCLSDKSINKFFNIFLLMFTHDKYKSNSPSPPYYSFIKINFFFVYIGTQINFDSEPHKSISIKLGQTIKSIGFSSLIQIKEKLFNI